MHGLCCRQIALLLLQWLLRGASKLVGACRGRRNAQLGMRLQKLGMLMRLRSVVLLQDLPQHTANLKQNSPCISAAPETMQCAHLAS